MFLGGKWLSRVWGPKTHRRVSLVLVCCSLSPSTSLLTFWGSKSLEALSFPWRFSEDITNKSVIIEVFLHNGALHLGVPASTAL